MGFPRQRFVISNDYLLSLGLEVWVRGFLHPSTFWPWRWYPLPQRHFVTRETREQHRSSVPYSKALVSNYTLHSRKNGERSQKDYEPLNALFVRRCTLISCSSGTATRITIRCWTGVTSVSVSTWLLGRRSASLAGVTTVLIEERRRGAGITLTRKSI